MNSGIDNAYALIMGISKYKDERIPKLNYTRADAEAVRDMLLDKHKVGLKEENVKVLLDDQATQFAIKNAISDWLFKGASQDSTVFVYFAGHGGVEEDRLGVEKDRLAKFILPWDAVFDNLYASTISSRDFSDLLSSIKSTKLVIFMDCCYSGAVSPARSRDIKIVDDPYEKIAKGEGRLVIAASKPDQRSYEDANVGHGIFTYCLLEGLSGKADFDDDAQVHVLELYKYLQSEVPKAAKKLAGGVQEPIMRGDLAHDFPIAINQDKVKKLKEERQLQGIRIKLTNLRSTEQITSKQYALAMDVLVKRATQMSQGDKSIKRMIMDYDQGSISLDIFRASLQDLIIEKGPKEPAPDFKRPSPIEDIPADTIQGVENQPVTKFPEKKDLRKDVWAFCVYCGTNNDQMLLKCNSCKKDLLIPIRLKKRLGSR